MFDADEPILGLLNELLELEFDTIEAYEEALERASEPDSRVVLDAFKRDHLKHACRLSAWVRHLGGYPATGGGLKSFVTRARVRLGRLAGGDAMILRAMRANEDDYALRYERAARSEALAGYPELIGLLEGMAETQRRHQDWFYDRPAQQMAA